MNRGPEDSRKSQLIAGASPATPCCLIAAILLPLAVQPAAAALLFDVLQDNGSAGSTLTISQPLAESFDILAYESSDMVFPDRIEFRFAPDLTLVIEELQPDWSSQTSIVTENLEQTKVTTFFFLGIAANESAESFRFKDGWTSSLSFSNPEGTILEIPPLVEVFGSVEPGDGSNVISLRESALLSVETVTPIPEPAAVGLCAVTLLASSILYRRR